MRSRGLRLFASSAIRCGGASSSAQRPASPDDGPRVQPVHFRPKGLSQDLLHRNTILKKVTATLKQLSGESGFVSTSTILNALSLEETYIVKRNGGLVEYLLRAHKGCFVTDWGQRSVGLASDQGSVKVSIRQPPPLPPRGISLPSGQLQKIVYSDEYYRRKWLPVPRECADMYVQYIPTFPVDVEEVFSRLPPRLRDRTMNPRKHEIYRPEDFFRKYKTLFHIVEDKFVLTTIRLVKGLKHPDRGKADTHYAHLNLAKDDDTELRKLLAKNAPVELTQVGPWVKGVEGARDLCNGVPERVHATLLNHPTIFQIVVPKGVAPRPGDDDVHVFDMQVRRRPKEIAPRSTDELDATTSDHPALVQRIVGIVKAANGSIEWVNILNTVYAELTPEEKKVLKQYRGLVNFLRVHGRLFEVSVDRSCVVLHSNDRPSPSQKSLTDVDDDDLPTHRSELRRMFPKHEYLNRDNLLEVIYDALPHNRGISFAGLVKRLPPLARAAIPHNRWKDLLSYSEDIVMWENTPGRYTIQRKELGEAPEGHRLDDTSTDEDMLLWIKSVISAEDGGVSEITVLQKVPMPVRKHIKKKRGLIAVAADFPGVLTVERRRSRVFFHLRSKVGSRYDGDHKVPPPAAPQPNRLVGSSLREMPSESVGDAELSSIEKQLGVSSEPASDETDELIRALSGED